MIQKIKNFIFTHKKISIIIVIFIIILGYFGYKKFFIASAQTEYITSSVKSGSISVSVTGSGQVSASNQIDLKPKVSADITYIGVKSGDIVTKGKLLFSLDSKTAKKSVRDAETSLETAKLSLEKIKIQNSDENMNASLQKIYDDNFNTILDVFTDLQSTFSGLETLLSLANLSENVARNAGSTVLSYRQKAESSYYQAESIFQTNKSHFRLISRDSSQKDIESIINETYNTATILSDVIKSTKNFVDYLVDSTDRSSDYNSSQTTLAGYANTIGDDISNLFLSKTNIKNYKDTALNNNLDIQSAELQVKQKENLLQDSKDTLSDYYIYAPFNGTISSVTAKLGDTASSTLATIITEQKIATISLNEIDIAKIKLGQKATLTFDAISNLTIDGEVSEIDSIGTVSQGVVSYNVKINFDINDERVKPGMSVSAKIITNNAQDVLIVPNSAIKNQNGTSYVQTLKSSEIQPIRIKVETGLIDDTNTQIISGLKAGDIIIVKSITNSSATSKNTTPSLINAVGGSRTSGRIGGSAGIAIPHN